MHLVVNRSVSAEIWRDFRSAAADTTSIYLFRPTLAMNYLGQVDEDCDRTDQLRTTHADGKVFKP